ncbi:hypothetical protein BDV93DRAFT_510222 [Ceratobasidium sp. AG-I]|nr:hypothetical protein BDV93DRAFT_510222 [Ceratobasidium sp. AG-I]
MAARYNKKTSDKGNGKASAKKWQYNNGSNDYHSEDWTTEKASVPKPPKKRVCKETTLERNARQNNKDNWEALWAQQQATKRHCQKRAADQAASLFIEVNDKTKRYALLQRSQRDLTCRHFWLGLLGLQCPHALKMLPKYFGRNWLILAIPAPAPTHWNAGFWHTPYTSASKSSHQLV